MSANINQELMSCFSVILCDHCKTRGRLFNKHHILSLNNNPFPGTRSHWLPIRDVSVEFYGGAMVIFEKNSLPSNIKKIKTLPSSTIKKNFSPLRGHKFVSPCYMVTYFS